MDPRNDPIRDPGRLEALRRTALLDAPAEESFDRLTRLAARVLDASASLVNLVDDRREFCLSAFDPSGRYRAGAQSSLDSSLCRYTVASAEPLVVDDAREHPLVRDNAAVRAGRVAAYLGVPLLTAGGHVLGTLCLVESEPRRWTPAEVEVLRDLADSAVTAIELRTDLVVCQAAEAALRESEARLRIVLQEAALGIALVDLSGRPVEVNPALQRMLGYTRAELRAKTFRDFTHPADVATDGALFAEVVRGARGHYQIEKRYLRKDGSVLWGRLTVSMARDEAGLPRFIVGMVEDLTEHRELQEARAELRLLAGLLPICMFCKKIRNESEEWERLESYIAHRSEAEFTHGCCPECMSRHYAGYGD